MLPELPVTDALPPLLAALAAGRNAVLVAPPGAGKTTLVPLALLDAPWRGDGTILMLEPRRLATRAAATRMAVAAGRAGRRHGRLPHPAGRRRLAGDPHRGRHRGPAGPPPAIRSGARRRRRGDPGRGARALAGIRSGAGTVPRPAARAAPGAAAARDVGHRRRRPPRRPDGRRGDRKRRPHVPGRRSATPPATSPARATCRTRWPARCAPRWRSTPATSSPSCPAWRKSAAPRRRWKAAARWCCRCTATCRRPSRIARCARPNGAASCWRPRSPRPR